MVSRCILAVVLLLQAATLSYASSGATSRDANYIVDNRINPNVQKNMYYAESSNILMSLSNFDKLYVSFENCVWSTYDVDDDTCGPDGHDEYWYMGLTECFRANAAYSLYGVPKGKKDTGCSSSTFITSLFTTAGVEAFTRSLAATGKLAFSDSYISINYTATDDDTVQDGGEDDESYPGGVSSICFQNATDGDNHDVEEDAPQDTPYGYGMTSFGLACDNKKFAIKRFDSAYCDLKAEISIEDTLDSFNSDIKKAQCIEIYSSSSWNGNTYYNGDHGGDVDEADPLSLLFYSQTCTLRDYPGLCPDPFKKLRSYAAAEEHAYVQLYEKGQSRAIRASSIALLTMGILLMIFAMYTRLRAAKLRITIKVNRKKTKPAPVEEPDGIVDSGIKTKQDYYGEATNANGQAL